MNPRGAGRRPRGESPQGYAMSLLSEPTRQRIQHTAHLQHAVHGLAPLPAPVVVAIGLGALVTVLWKEVWVIAGHVSVLAHEGAHALVG
jgi:hypothetical protein